MKKVKELVLLKTKNKSFSLVQKEMSCISEGVLGKNKLDLNLNQVSLIEKDNLFFFTASKDQQTFLSNLKLSILGTICGFGKELNIKGIGYKVWKIKDKIYFKLGYSHWLQYEIPKNILIKGKKNRLIVFGPKKDQVGIISYLLRSVKQPDPYKGKGIQYLDENLVLKVGKQRQR